MRTPERDERRGAIDRDSRDDGAGDAADDTMVGCRCDQAAPARGMDQQNAKQIAAAVMVSP